MALNSETYQEFQRQLELQQKSDAESATGKPKVKVDEDGTEYEWDAEKKAWFPKFNVDILMKYQGNYGPADQSEREQTYIDPVTKVTFLWDLKKNCWAPKPNQDGTRCRYTHANGTVYVWNLEKNNWELESKGEDSDQQPNSSHVYTDPKSGVEYKWDPDRNLWVAEDGKVMYPYGHNAIGGTSYTDPKSGVIYNWDKDKNEWVADKHARNNKSKKSKKEAPKRKAAEPTWFDPSQVNNTNVYVQGLPTDVTLDEFEALMSKCGIIMTNPHTGKPKLKLYKDKDGNLKGDGLCCYLKSESLDLALQLLDESDVRKNKISVQKANFELKGSYDPSKKPKMLSKKEKVKIRKQHETMLDWRLARKEAAKKSERVIIFKNMFDPKEFDQDATLITDIRDDLRTECEKFGPVKKVLVFDRHPDGVCSVAFKDFDAATACVEAMNGRWFAEKKVECAPWDGVTDYQVEETDREREERLDNWEKFLNEGDDKEPDQPT